MRRLIRLHLLVLDVRAGGHGDATEAGSTDAGCCGGHSHSLGRTCDGVPEVLKAARDTLKGGADFIKIMCGGGVASPTVRTLEVFLIHGRSTQCSVIRPLRTA